MTELTVEECERHVRHYAVARDRAEEAWIGYQGEKRHKKEQLRRAYEFADRVLLGWERRLEIARARRSGEPLLQLVAGGLR